MSAADESNKQDTTSSIPKFRFEVDFGTELNGAVFLEVAGLETDTHELESHKGSKPAVSTDDKIPSVAKYSNVTLKRGVITNNSAVWTCFNESELNTIKPVTTVIKLVGENNNVIMQWQLNNAWPTKIEAANLTSEGNEIAVESLEIAFETMVISSGGYWSNIGYKVIVSISAYPNKKALRFSKGFFVFLYPIIDTEYKSGKAFSSTPPLG
jgi:phage tail-like protein